MCGCVQAYALRQWYDTVGSTAALSSMSSGGGGLGGGSGPTTNISARKTIAAIKSDTSGFTEKDIFTVKGTINMVRCETDRPPWYPACTTEKCNKKVTEAMGGGWSCEKVRRATVRVGVGGGG